MNLKAIDHTPLLMKPLETMGVASNFLRKGIEMCSTKHSCRKTKYLISIANITLFTHNKHTHTHTHTHIYIHTHTYTHTHTQMSVSRVE